MKVIEKKKNLFSIIPGSSYCKTEITSHLIYNISTADNLTFKQC